VWGGGEHCPTRSNFKTGLIRDRPIMRQKDEAGETKTHYVTLSSAFIRALTPIRLIKQGRGEDDAWTP
jgi:hypothetical protein